MRSVVNYLKEIHGDVAEVHREFKKEASRKLSCLEKRETGVKKCWNMHQIYLNILNICVFILRVE